MHECSECGKKYKTERGLENHMAKKHPKVKYIYQKGAELFKDE